MLGLIKFKQRWEWSVCGKLPLAGDYFQVGSNAAILNAFSDWVKNGFHLFITRKSHAVSQYSWRFWAKGQDRETLVCGIVKDSSDNIGRPYPLLISGTGSLKNWLNYWELVPFVLDNTWKYIENLSITRFADFNQLEKQARMITPPRPQWLEFSSQINKEREPGGYPSDQLIESVVKEFSQKDELLIPLSNRIASDSFLQACSWHLSLKQNLKDIPNLVFMGGTLDKASLSIFKRPLVYTDFVKLWSV